MLWSSSLWEVLTEIASFKKNETDPNKGKHVFSDEDSEEQEAALSFYGKIREFIPKWANTYGTESDGKKNKFSETYKKVFEDQIPTQPQPKIEESRLPYQEVPRSQIDESRRPYMPEDRSNIDESRRPYQIDQGSKVNESRLPYGIQANSHVDESRMPYRVNEASKVDESRLPYGVQSNQRVDESRRPYQVDPASRVNESRPPYGVQAVSHIDESRRPYQVDHASKIDESRRPYQVDAVSKIYESRLPYGVQAISHVDESRTPYRQDNMSNINESRAPYVLNQQSNTYESRQPYRMAQDSKAGGSLHLPVQRDESMRPGPQPRPSRPPPIQAVNMSDDSIEDPMINRLDSGQFGIKVQQESQQSPLSGNLISDPSRKLAGSSLSKRNSDENPGPRNAVNQPQQLVPPFQREDGSPRAAMVESMQVSRAPSPEKALRSQPQKTPGSFRELNPGTPGYMASFDRIDEVRNSEHQHSPRFSVQSNSSRVMQVDPKYFTQNEPVAENAGGPRLPPPLRLRPVDEDLDDSVPMASSRIDPGLMVEPPRTIMRVSPLPRVSKPSDHLSSIPSEHELEERASSYNNVSNMGSAGQASRKNRNLVPVRETEMCSLIRDVFSDHSGL